MLLAVISELHEKPRGKIELHKLVYRRIFVRDITFLAARPFLSLSFSVYSLPPFPSDVLIEWLQRYITILLDTIPKYLKSAEYTQLRLTVFHELLAISILFILSTSSAREKVLKLQKDSECFGNFWKYNFENIIIWKNINDSLLGHSFL